jgi:hypothetical protein
VLIFIGSRNQGDMDKKGRLDCISQRNSLSPTQGKITQVKIMLIPSNLDKDENRLKNQVAKLKLILMCVISLLSIRSHTIKRMQHGDLDKIKVLKIDSKSNVKKPNSKSVLKSVLPVRSVLHTSQTG